jgi:hypothetical protein
MTEPLITDRPSDIDALATPFEAMATQVRHNGHASFGGAFVIVPPVAGGTEPIVTLVLDPKQDPILFWSSVKSKIEMVLAQLDEAARMQGFRR